MGGICTRIVSIDSNNNGQSDIEEIITRVAEVVVERILARVESPQRDSETGQSVDVHIALDNKS